MSFQKKPLNLNMTLSTFIYILFAVCAQASDIDIRMNLNDGGFGSFDPFQAELILENREMAPQDVELFAVLEVADGFYFWPDFEESVLSRTAQLNSGTKIVTILDFIFPDIDAFIPYGPLFFWGAWYQSSESYGYDSMEFWLDPDRKWTPVPTATPTISRISVQSISGRTGDDVDVKIQIRTGLDPLKSLGFELHYCASSLIFIEGAAGNLTSGWEYFEAVESEPGIIKVRGMGMTAVPWGSEGLGALLSFRVDCDDCVEGDQCGLLLDMPLGGITGWERTDGTFTYTGNPVPTATTGPEDTSTPVPTPTPRPSFTPTPASTDTPESTPTAFPTATPETSATAISTPTPTPPPSQSPSPTPTLSPPPSPTPSPTHSPSPSPSLTPSPVPTPSPTPSPSPVPSSTPSQTPSPTQSPTATPSPTPTSSATPTTSPSPSSSPTPTSPNTPTPSPSATMTPVPTETPSPSPTPSPWTPPPTGTPSPTATAIPATHTPTVTPTPGPPLTPTPTPSPPAKLPKWYPFVWNISYR